jgi:tRNA C32,U32 (ribose-2'-O)-methylase TrmJ
MARSTAVRLAAHQRRYRELAESIADIGFVTAGTISHRRTRCGKPNCRCHADPPQLHGPYWQWTAKVDGKTVTRRLTPAEAELYQQWIANDRQLRALIAQMRKVATKTTETDHERERSTVRLRFNRKLRAVIESALPNSLRSEVASIIDIVPTADYEAHPGFEALVLDEQVVIPWRIYNPQPEPSARMV